MRLSIGVWYNEMKLWNHGIEWSWGQASDYNFPCDDGDTVEIGITADLDRKVTDYDGVFELPDPAIMLLERHGFNCTEVVG